jgi:hypothetical protein
VLAAGLNAGWIDFQHRGAEVKSKMRRQRKERELNSMASIL